MTSVHPVGFCEFCGCQFRSNRDMMNHCCADMQEAARRRPMASVPSDDDPADEPLTNSWNRPGWTGEATVPAPSDEALESASLAFSYRQAVATAYAIDLPALLAEARAEGRSDALHDLEQADRYGANLVKLVQQRDEALAKCAEAQAARTAEIVAWLREETQWYAGLGGSKEKREGYALGFYEAADAIAAKFNPEGE